MIAICLVTYNHQSYILNAIESVLAQKVNVPFKLFIGEDNSTDNTKNICEKFQNKFPDKIELISNKNNLGLVENTLNLFRIIKEKGYSFIAMLDGDDYWIDEFKLQKQLNILVNNTRYGLVHTNNEVLWDEKRIQRKDKVKPLIGNVFDRIEEYDIANCTVFFRASLLSFIDFEELKNQGFLSCDYVIYAIFSKYTEFAFIKDFTAVWRRGHASVSNTNSKEKDIAYVENELKIWKYLGNKFPQKFGNTEYAYQAWRNYRIFNIAFRYKDFNLVNEILASNIIHNKTGFSFRIKKLCAKNRLLFYLWFFIKY